MHTNRHNCVEVKTQQKHSPSELTLSELRRPINVIIAMSKFFYSVDQT